MQESQAGACGGGDDAEMMSPSKLEHQQIMSQNLNGDIQNKKIISYQSKAPNAPEGRWACENLISS